MRGSVLTAKERSYVIGLFLGDGYSNFNPKDRHYRVDFCLNSEKDKDIIVFLEYLLKKAGYNCFKVKDKRFNATSIRINSKQLMVYLNEEKQKLQQTKIKNRQKIIGLLSGLIDAEGFVGHGEILLSQQKRITANIIKSLSDYLNLTKKVRWVKNPKGKNIMRIRISTRFKKLKHISRKVLRYYK